MPRRSPRAIRNAGAIFIGAHTPEAIGDYVAGSNHVLPTARSARFSSGLGVLDFMKRTSLLKCGPEQLRALGPAAIALGEAEGLDRPCPLGRHPPQPVMSPAKTAPLRRQRLVAVTLDEETIGRSNPDVEHERRWRSTICSSRIPSRRSATTAGLTRCISPSPATGWCSTSASEDGTPVVAHLLSLTPLRRIVKDYYTICDSYYQAIRTATPDKIEAIDMGRRGIHDDGSQHPDGAAQGQGEGRFRHRAPPVHADLRAALERVSA